jgi:hypothetical protein
LDADLTNTGCAKKVFLVDAIREFVFALPGITSVFFLAESSVKADPCRKTKLGDPSAGRLSSDGA